MHDIWRQRFPQSSITEQRLLNQKRSIEKNNLLTRVELQRIESIVISQNESSDAQTEEVVMMSPSIQDSDANNEVEQSEGVTNDSTLNEWQRQMKYTIIEYVERYHNHEQRPAIKKIDSSVESHRMVADVNLVVGAVATNNITELNTLIYAAAKLVEKCVHGDRRGDQRSSERPSMPPWKIRMTKNIEGLRQDVNRLTSAKCNNGRIPYYLHRKYRLDARGINEALEDAKQRLIALSHRLKRYEERNKQYRMNKLFQSNPRKVYQQLRGRDNDDVELQDKELTRNYWQEL